MVRPGRRICGAAASRGRAGSIDLRRVVGCPFPYIGEVSCGGCEVFVVVEHCQVMQCVTWWFMVDAPPGAPQRTLAFRDRRDKVTAGRRPRDPGSAEKLAPGQATGDGERGDS